MYLSPNALKVRRSLPGRGDMSLSPDESKAGRSLKGSTPAPRGSRAVTHMDNPGCRTYPEKRESPRS